MLDLYDKTLYTEPDGSKWWRIFHHNSPATNGVFSQNDTFQTGVYMDENRWYQGQLVYTYDIKEYMIVQQETSEKAICKARLTQTKNFISATYNDVKPSAGNVTWNQDSEHYSIPTDADNGIGGLYLRNNGNYIGKARTNQSQWGGFCAFGTYGGGAPGCWIDDEQNATVKSGFLDVYMRVPTTGFIVVGSGLNEMGVNGGTCTFTVSSNAAWTATVVKGSGFITLDVMSGTAGVTTVTATVSQNTLGYRDGKIVFSNGTINENSVIKQDSPLKYWRPLEYIVTDGTQYFVTDYVPNMETSMEYKMRKADRAVSIDCCDAWIGQDGSDDGDGGVNGRNFCIRGSVSCVFGNSGNKNYSVPNFNTSTDHVFVMDKTGFTVDGVQGGTWSPTAFQNTRPLSISSTYKLGRYGAQRFYYATLSENGSTVCGLKAAQTVEGQVGVADTVSGKMYHPQWLSGYSNPLGKGPLVKEFTASRYSMAFEPAGGEYEMTVTSDTTWQCTAATGYTISPMSGSAGTTTVTVTAPPNAGTEKIKETSTFYDAEGYAFDLKLSTKTAGGHSEIYLGTVEAEGIKFGSYDVSKIMMGTVEVYGAGAFSGLKVKPTTVTLMNTDSEVITIKASEPWTITNIPDWLTLSKTSGTAGTVQITMTPTQPSENRTATMTVTTANYSSTFTVDNRPVTLVDYIHTQTLSSTNSNTQGIGTGINDLITNLTMNVKGICKGSYRCVFSSNIGDTSGFDIADDKMYFMNGGWDNNLPVTNGDVFDFTGGNNYITNNITGATAEAAVKTTNFPYEIKIWPNSHWFQSGKIWKGETLLFDGHAALDDNGNPCVYDFVSGTFKTNSNLTLVAETV